MIRYCCAIAGVSILTACGAAPPVDGPETRVLVVANGASETSLRLADVYARSRDIAASHRVVIHVPLGDAVSRQIFDDRIRAPLTRWWEALDADVAPLYVVLIKGVPLRIAGDASRDGDEASVDSELTSLPSWAMGEAPHLAGPRPNPLFSVASTGERPPLARELELSRICLVTRIDGFTEADAGALLERASAAETEVRPGRVLIDHDGRRGQPTGTRALRRLAEASLPAEVEFDSSAAFVTSAHDLVAYAGWGSNDTRFVRGADFAWLPGAVVATFVSSSARTVDEPPSGWRPGRARETELEFHGTTQSLAADWIRSGASGVIGYVSEPWLEGCARPEVFIPAYLGGMTLGEAAYRALPVLSWRSVIFGDPLCRAPVIAASRRRP